MNELHGIARRRKENNCAESSKLSGSLISRKEKKMKTLTNKYNLIAMILIAMTMFGANNVLAQNDGWNKEFSSMTFDTLYIDTTGGAAQGNYFVRTKFLGDDVSDQVIWGKKFSAEIPFQGYLYIEARESVCNFYSGTQFAVTLFHSDTTISSDLFADICGHGIWTSGSWIPINWSGTLTGFDSIAIIQRYHPLTTVFVEQTTDFDAFHVKLNGEWVMFYDGGEMGKVEGLIYNDKNQNAVQDAGETGMSGWTVYLATGSSFLVPGESEQSVMLSETKHLRFFAKAQNDMEIVDSTVTDINGYYSFAELPRGSYQLWMEKRVNWNQTFPIDTVINFTVGDTLGWTQDFGQCAPRVSEIILNARWNMVSIPRLGVFDSLKSSIFPHAVSNAWAYNGHGYQIADSLLPGKGYWLKFAAPETVTVVGDSIKQDTIDVRMGWNLIGTLTTLLPANVVASNPPGMITSKFFGYCQGYVTADTLIPGKGYWIKTNGFIQQLLTDTPPSPPESEIASPPQADRNDAPKEFSLEQNWPNPFNPTTIIRFLVPSSSPLVTLKVYDLLGQEVVTLVNEILTPGNYSVQWNADNNPSGMYFYRLSAGSFVETKKLVLIR
jgi:hypothetical protein